MPNSALTARLSFLLLLFCGTLCSAMTVPYMGFFLVEGLGYPPWIISIYGALAVGLTLLANRQFARRIDRGARVFPLIGLAAGGYVLATGALTLAPGLATVLSVGVMGFGLSSSAVSTMFSLGGSLAERHQIPRPRFNAHMRATTSTAWMIGPAVTFLMADAVAAEAVFALALVAGLIWLGLWWGTLPRDIRAGAKPVATAQAGGKPGPRHALWLAAGFVFCLSFAHSLSFSSLPIFYVQEVGLPGYAPGLAFSVKTFVEVFAIFSTPVLIARFGLWRALLGTAMLAVIAIQILARVESFEQMLAGAALEGLYYGFYASLGISYVQSFAPEHPARATALYWNTLMVSGVLAGPLVGLIAQFFDFQTVLLLASGVAAIAVAVLALARAPDRAEA